MDDIYLFVGLGVLFATQILCLAAKKLWVRLIPTLLTAVLMAVCFLMYALSVWTNWGYLILLFLLAMVLFGMGLVWLAYGIIRAARSRRR